MSCKTLQGPKLKDQRDNHADGSLHGQKNPVIFDDLESADYLGERVDSTMIGSQIKQLIQIDPQHSFKHDVTFNLLICQCVNSDRSGIVSMPMEEETVCKSRETPNSHFLLESCALKEKQSKTGFVLLLF